MKRVPIGLQLYSVRRDCGKDGGGNLPNVLRQVAAMGYDGVEFAGWHGWSARDIRKMLDENDLACCGAHVPLDTLLGDELERSIELHAAVGNKYLIVPSLPEGYRESIDAWRRTAGIFNEIAERLAPAGMAVGYHSHAVDFQQVQGRVGWEVFFDAARPDVIMQLDIGNAMAGGGDCVALLRKYPGRARTVHVKEHGGSPDALVGEGDVDWPEILAVLGETAQPEWLIIEHERDSARAMDDAERCLRNLRAIIAGL
ncbi:MAG: sugar phosphate isomerase/epimerase [Planctomycetes bacterium]|nr:sugar phosphate isomerase/epimerase [Planctomycetota bacterium]